MNWSRNCAMNPNGSEKPGDFFMTMHERFMRLALRLAKRAEGMTSPNPLVGCVIVLNGRVVGKGYHKRAGTPHAEVHALRSAGAQARGATLYVTLEPCDHYGRTPPCTDAIVNAGIKKVFIGMKDPNPINSGRGMRKLKRRGITVTAGISEAECRAINKPYGKWITTGVPYVTLKLAESLDGKIATRTGDSKWISGEGSRAYVQKLRQRVDAVMVGVNTVMADDPLLIPHGAFKKNPVRVVVDAGLSIPLSSRLAATTGRAPLWIAASNKAAGAKKNGLMKKGAEVIGVDASKGKIDMRGLLRILGKRMITHVLVEGGAALAGDMLDHRCIDEAVFFIAPKIIGGKDAVTAVSGNGVRLVSQAVTLKNISIQRIKDDVMIRGDVCLPV
ncbi:MAG: bifunctional diaminohydroxyphosphoribosylaminopyrimidine deaminase/5-amino-6-(5-phosphoribosylamino)uracil reductase RibD [Candidatus Omnitrophica bacterium]|nr:bifunctional diaminohydroxyphosphoribosylaminopyrimidine deaminase/5-amino-6-(5-phosphoribosylamino)uracil reductase RibD [Candidatus Omnitrophota bacterium]